MVMTGFNLAFLLTITTILMLPNVAPAAEDWPAIRAEMGSLNDPAANLVSHWLKL
jgi:hypothetical protein